MRNSCDTPPGTPPQAAKKGWNHGRVFVRLRAYARAPGTEFLDAETGHPKSSPRRVNAHRDQNLKNEWPKIPHKRPIRRSAGNTRFERLAAASQGRVQDSIGRIGLPH